MKHLRLAGGLLIAALLAVPAISSAQGYGYGHRAYNDANRTFSGTISAVNGGALAMSNGRTVFLKNGTVINPTGTRLQPGMRISVVGSPAGDGNINASEVDISGNGFNRGFRHDRDRDRDRDRDDRYENS
jgi:hypothetical protein